MSERAELYGVAVEGGKVMMTDAAASPGSYLVAVDLNGPDGGELPDVWEFPPIHATRGGRCAIVSAEAFAGFCAGLVGIPAPIAVTPTRNACLLDFDERDWNVGLLVRVWESGQERRAELTVDEFWDALVALAGQGG